MLGQFHSRANLQLVDRTSYFRLRHSPLAGVSVAKTRWTRFAART
jgi:hypothetical protein